MSGKILIVVLILLAFGLGGYLRYSGITFPSAAPAVTKQVATQPQQQSQAMATADQTYLTNTMQWAGNNYRAWREGVTVQNLRLPSGKAMKMTITKTKTGWCPKRRENLYHMGVSVSE